ncbi:MAG: hypothetical protein ABRQ39_24175 [Candidatus Eremiobacterota bacterium]
MQDEEIKKILDEYNFFSHPLNEQLLRSCFHDLNNLICGISMFAELIELRFKDEKCQKIIKTAWKSQEIIKALQNYTFCYDIYKPYDVNACLESFFMILSHIREFSNIKYTLNLARNMPQINGNRYLFQQCLSLLSSRISCTGDILVSSQMKKNSVIIIIHPAGWRDLEEFKKSEDCKFCNQIALLHSGTFDITPECTTFSFNIE